MSANFKLIPKFSENLMEVWCVLPGGECRVIANVTFPNDHQMSHNVKTGEEICAILRKRIRGSV